MNKKAFNKLKKLHNLPIASLSMFVDNCPILETARVGKAGAYSKAFDDLSRVYDGTNGRPCDRCGKADRCTVFKIK